MTPGSERVKTLPRKRLRSDALDSALQVVQKYKTYKDRLQQALDLHDGTPKAEEVDQAPS